MVFVFDELCITSYGVPLSGHIVKVRRSTAAELQTRLMGKRGGRRDHRAMGPETKRIFNSAAVTDGRRGNAPALITFNLSSLTAQTARSEHQTLLITAPEKTCIWLRGLPQELISCRLKPVFVMYSCGLWRGGHCNSDEMQSFRLSSGYVGICEVCDTQKTLRAALTS